MSGSLISLPLLKKRSKAMKQKKKLERLSRRQDAYTREHQPKESKDSKTERYHKPGSVKHN